jgi:parvulin-like peptidyl-prolyl isomerase
MAKKVKNQVIHEDDSSKSEIIRRFKANPFIFIGTIVVLIIVIVAFVFVPAIVPNAGGATADLNFGAYDKIPITYVPGNYFAQVQSSLESYQRSSINESNAQYMNYQIWRAAFDETVVRTAILQEMKKAGYTVPKEVIDREVALQFMDNGRFSAALYRQVDTTTRLSLRRQAQDRIAEEYYLADVEGLLKPAAEKAFIGSMGTQLRSFEGAAFSIYNYPEAEITSYAAENPALFRTTHLSRITINSGELEARQVLASIQDGTSTFEDAAKTHSQDSYAEKGGDIGVKLAFELSSEGLDTQQQEQLSGLARGSYSDILKLGSGWAFFRVEDTAYPADTGDESVRAKILTYMLDFQRGRIEDYFFNQAEELARITASDGFDEAVYEKSLQKFSFGPLPVNYGDVDLFATLSSFSQAELSYASSNENFWQTAFSTPIRTTSRPLVLGGSVVVLYPLEETTAAAEDIENIGDYYSAYWLMYTLEQAVHSFFLNDGKLEDHFIDTYISNFWAQN